MSQQKQPALKRSVPDETRAGIPKIERPWSQYYLVKYNTYRLLSGGGR